MKDAQEAAWNVTRRGFLKTSAIATGAVIAGGVLPLGLCNIAFAEEYKHGQPLYSDEQIFHGCCRGNCSGTCKINVHVRDNKIVKTSRRPWTSFPDGSIDRICLRGLSQVGNIYGPNRIRYPMKRVGERGSGEWERITWEEAIKEVTDTWKAVQSKYGEQALAYTRGSGNMGTISGVASPMYNVFFNKINASMIKIARDQANTRGINRVFGNLGDWVLNEPCDFKNSKHFFVWANNITDAQIHDWHFIREAQEGGTMLIVIDPIYTQLASKADLWVPIQPGTDAALELSMMYVLMHENLVNIDFLKRHTCAPFLVRSDNGLFLRMSDLGVEAQTIIVEREQIAAASSSNKGDLVGQSSTVEKVIDYVVGLEEADGELCAVEKAIDPALHGEYVFEGVKCRTAYDLLVENVDQYPPEIAEKICKVPAETIVKLARLAADGPNIHRLGWGSNSYTNGIHAAHAAATLAGLTGQIGYEGAGTGMGDFKLYYGINAVVSGMTAAKYPQISALFIPEIMRTGKYKGKDYPIKALYVYSGNPICNQVNTNEYINDILGNMESYVVADYTYTDTVHYADIVLPACHWFETEDVVLITPTECIIHSEKAIDPLYESKNDFEILKLLAAGMGQPDLINKTPDEYMQQVINTKTSTAMGISWERLKKDEDLYFYPTRPWIPWRNAEFRTESGRLEFYVEKPTVQFDMGQTFDVEREHLARYFNPTEAYEGSPQWSKYKLILLSERPRFRVHSMWSDNVYLRELDPEPTVKINPDDAAQRGISDGDYVEVYNDRGHCVAKAVYNEAIRPGCLVYPKSWQMNQHKAGCWSELLTSAYDPVGVNESYFDNLVEIRVWEEE
ncbi:MAG: molybdopterin-dependent oxidoreductase [Selenomonadaceae bacterium]|nr:molybdopterin-dependent oxidoreductase [Selenomonadaceae bacterium]